MDIWFQTAASEPWSKATVREQHVRAQEGRTAHCDLGRPLFRLGLALPTYIRKVLMESPAQQQQCKLSKTSMVSEHRPVSRARVSEDDTIASHG